MVDRKTFIDDFEDLDESHQRPKNSRQRKKGFQLPVPEPLQKYIPWIIGGAFLLLLLILFIGGDDSPQTDIHSTLKMVSERIQELEDKMARLAQDQEELRQAVAQVSSEQDLDQVLEQLQAMQTDLETFKSTTRQDITRLENAQQKLLSGAQPPSRDTGATAQDVKVHTVQEGENLFRIGLQYDITADQIRRWNDLGPNEPIHPGQKLKIGPGS
jgi:LysM repeat protein